MRAVVDENARGFDRSSEIDKSTREMKTRQKGLGQFVVSCAKASEWLETSKVGTAWGTSFQLRNPTIYVIFRQVILAHDERRNRTITTNWGTHQVVRLVYQSLLRSLGPTNFSHLWEDNPVLDPDEKRKESAENCVALSCISALGGRFEEIEELMEAQEALPMTPEDRATATEPRRACARLLKRDV